MKNPRAERLEREWNDIMDLLFEVEQRRDKAVKEVLESFNKTTYTLSNMANAKKKEWLKELESSS